MEAQRGLTLIELVIALTITLVVAGLATSSLANALEASRAASARADFVSSIALATARATLAGSRAVICPSSDEGSCSDSADWSQGWMVFLDANGSRELEGGERVLRRQSALPGQVRLRSTDGRTRIVFQGNGGNGGSNATFTLCDGRGPAKARSLILANFGRLREDVASPQNAAAACAR